MAKIVKWAVDVSGTPETRSSEICSLQVLNQVISNINERQKKADNKETSSGKDNEDFDEDDVTLQQVNSDDEDSANAPSTHAAALVEAFQGHITNIENVLRSDVAGTPIANSYSTAETVPLGALRLHTVELILKLVQMRNASLYTFLKDSLVFERIINLVKAFPWNNFLQLKVINLFEEVLNSCQNAEFKAAVLEGSGIGKAIVEMAENPTYETEGGKPVRHGYMAVVIDIANKMVKRTE